MKYDGDPVGAGFWNTPDSEIYLLVRKLRAVGYDVATTTNTIRVLSREPFSALCDAIDGYAQQLDRRCGTDIIKVIPEFWTLGICCLSGNNRECETGHYGPCVGLSENPPPQ